MGESKASWSGLIGVRAGSSECVRIHDARADGGTTVRESGEVEVEAGTSRGSRAPAAECLLTDAV